MKIDASRYTMFWANPDRYRLRECWKISPEEPSPDSFAALRSFGRRRGTAFHELVDAAYRGVPRNEAIQSLKDGGFDDKVISTAVSFADVALARYGADRYLAHEVLFESPIPGSPHILVGRIDSVVWREDEVFVRDYKTSKYRSKQELGYKGAEYCKSAQVGFYLIGAEQLGFHTRKFTYSLLSSKRQDPRVEINEFTTERTAIELNQLRRSVHQTCELIEFLKREYGVENHWPVLAEKFETGYEPQLGRKMYSEFIPDGFVPKVEHLECMREGVA